MYIKYLNLKLMFFINLLYEIDFYILYSFFVYDLKYMYLYIVFI